MNQQMVDEGDNIWEVDAAGKPVRFVGQQQPAPSPAPQGPQPFTIGTKRAPKVDVPTGYMWDAGAGLAVPIPGVPVKQDGGDKPPAGFRWTATGDLEPIPGGPADKTSRGGGSNKSMRQGDADKLESAVSTYDALNWGRNSFQDDFAGNAWTGEAENWAQQKFGTGTPGQRDWWARFRATDNQIRNELFGASLTDGEKAAYEATTISPSMRPEIIRENLAQREAIVRKGMQRRANRLVAGGFSAEEVRAGLGEYADTFLPPEGAQQAEAPQAAAPQANASPLGNVVGQSQATTQYPEQLYGLGDNVREMFAQRRSADEIVDYINQFAPGIGKASPEQIRWVRENVAQRDSDPAAWARKNVNWRGFEAMDAPGPTSGPSMLESIAMSAPGATAISAANAVSAGLLDEMSSDPMMAQAVKDQMREERPIASLAGDIAGGTIGMVGLNRGISALGQGGMRLASWGGGIAPDMIYGAAYGAGENNDNRLGGAAIGAGSAAAGNYVGNRAVGMFGRGMRGVSAPAVRYLTQRNIPLTLGQTLGNSGPIGRGVAKMESLPVIGDMLHGRRMDSIRAFNRAAYEDALQPIGAQIQGEAGQEAVDQAQQAVSNAYRNALEGVRVQAENQFINDIGPQLAAGRQIPTTGDEFGWVMDNQIGPMFDNSGTLTGETMQGALQNLRSAGRDFSKQGAMGNAAATATRNVENSLMDLVDRQSPGTTAALQSANTANRNVSILEDAGLSGLNGEVGTGFLLRRSLETL